MVDFLMVSTRSGKRGTIEIYPKFMIKKSSDLMIRGGDFYAIWLEDKGLWSTEEQDAVQLIDKELDKFAEENRQKFDSNIRVLHMWDAESGMIDSWHKYCQKQMRDSYHMLDEKLIFANTETTKKDYASKKLPYSLEEGDLSAYDKLMSVIYSPEEREKIEWAIGSVVNGDSKKLQKFMVLYGAAGTGKSTVLNIIQQLFEGYYSVFDAKALGSSNNDFALEAFKSNPLVAIQHDGDLSKIEDNTRLNSLVSHEMMIVNEKFKSGYANRFKCFLFMGTNKPVKISDAKSGLIRRLIDVSPSGNKLDPRDYKATVKQISFELGAIASHCLEVYSADPGKYDNYVPFAMLGASNDFYNFVLDSYFVFKKEDGTTLKAAWEMYRTYCDEAKVSFPYSQRIFKEELKNYFREYKDRVSADDGARVRSYYSGFRLDKFEDAKPDVKKNDIPMLALTFTESIFDSICADYLAQYATAEETPSKKWSEVTTKLSSLNTKKLHYVKVPENHIVIDFDIPDENGNKCLEKNLQEAAKWPPTYAELSKSGCGVHLHYIYSGDPTRLSRVYDEHIEVKVFLGKSSLRRKLTKCNDIPIATINSGLPLKGDDKMVNFESVKSERGLRRMIERNLGKEIHPGTKPSIDFIDQILKDAYSSGLKYDVTDMQNAIFAFAAQSTNHSDYCLKVVNQMKFKSDEPSPSVNNDTEKLVFYDVEVFPNLFVVDWKLDGEENPVVKMINPKPKDVEDLMKFRLVGFNCRRYDNHILYAALIGYSNEELYKLSQEIINGGKRNDCFFSEAYNISYTDIYDFSSKKQSLKKFEIELGIHHQELGLPWDQPVPEKQWPLVADYCANDVLATEAVFHARKADFTARQILADVAGMSVNDTTNTLTTKIIFGNNKKPQDKFNYRDMGDTTQIFDPDADIPFTMGPPEYDEFTVFTKDGKPIFPGYKYERGVSTYRDEEAGEGGYVYSEPEMYWNVALLDIASMHPSSIIAETLFGPEYTKRFEEIKEARVAIKHKEFERAGKMLDGKLAKYLSDEDAADNLAGALKIAINSVYGLTSASFDNPFHDPRNKDNIVAKRGALFMINLKHEVMKRGFTVAHIKTDSIKIPNATPEIIKFVQDYGKLYGYNFEHEATYDRMCLVNDAVYIAKYATVEHCAELYGQAYVDSAKDILKDCKKHPGEWTATGTQFQVPYVFKKLFSREDILFEDLCETKSVTTSIYIDRSPEEAAIYINNPDIVKEDSEDILLDNGHSLHYVGKVGLFCPVKENTGGGSLVRQCTDKDGNTKYNSVTGSKGYLWMESEIVKTLGKEDSIDRSYYNKMVDEAVQTISQYGDFEQFVSDDSNAPDIPPWESPDEPWQETTNFDVR